MMTAKLQLSSTASLHAGFIFDPLFVTLSPAVSLTHRANTRGNAPVHQAEEKEQFSGSL